MNLLKDKRGQTMILIATLLGFLMVIVASSSIDLIKPAFDQEKRMKNSDSAYYEALGAVEVASFDITHNDPGFEYDFNDENNGWKFMQNLPEGHTVKYRVTGRSKNANPAFPDTYAIPDPGTGNAGIDCENYDYETDLAENGNDWDTVIKNPCNWSKLKKNEYAVIPLYVDEGGGVILNPRTIPPADGSPFINLQEIQVKMRTPCRKDALSLDEWGNCTDEDRYQLDCEGGCNDYNYKKGDDTIVNWEIKGECDKGGGGTEMCAIWANDSLQLAPHQYERDEYNSEIDESKINDGIVLGYKMITISQVIINDDFGKTVKNMDGIKLFSYLTTMSKPVLQMQIIKSPKAGFPDNELGPKNVPYLEYQIIYKVNNGETLPNNIRKVEAQANVNNYVRRMEKTFSHQGSMSGFVIIN